MCDDVMRCDRKRNRDNFVRTSTACKTDDVIKKNLVEAKTN
jgi:hypothetical protein